MRSITGLNFRKSLRDNRLRDFGGAVFGRKGVIKRAVLLRGRSLVKWIRPHQPEEIAMTLTLELDLPDDLAQFRLPAAVGARLQTLLDRQDGGQPLSEQERAEAEGLVNLAEFLTLLRLRVERTGP